MNRLVRSLRFEKLARAQAKALLKQNPESWKEYKRRTRWRERWPHGGWFWVLLAAVYFYFVIFSKGGDPDRSLLLGLILYSTGTVWNRAISLRTRLVESLDRFIMIQLPMGDADFFRWQTTSTLRGSSFVFVLWLFAFGMQAAHGRISPLEAFFFSLLQWVVTVAAILTIYHLKLQSRIPIGGIFVVLAFVACFSTTAANLMEPLARVLPFGWLSPSLLGGPGVQAGIAFGAVSALVLPFLYARARDKYSSNEIQLVADEEENQEKRDAAAADMSASPHRPEIRQIQQQMQPVKFAHGWIERIARRLFSQPRELSVADFMVAGTEVSWSLRWRNSALISLVACAATFLPQIPTWLLLLVFAGVCLYSAPLLGGQWEGMSPTQDFSKSIPVFAVYPASYSEMSRVLFKVNALRTVAAAPLIIALMASLAVRLGLTPVKAAWWAAIAVLLLIASQPLFTLVRLSNVTTPHYGASLKRIAIDIAAAILGIAAIGLAVLCFVLPPILVIPLVILLFFASLLAWWLYSLSFNQGKVDLVKDAGT